MRDLDSPWMAEPVIVHLECGHWEVNDCDGQHFCNDESEGQDIVAAFQVARKTGKYESPRLVVTVRDSLSCKVRFKGRLSTGIEEGRLRWHEVIIPDQAVEDAVVAEGKYWERMHEETEYIDWSEAK